jgi:tetratricopeptide (TPR) repeat protein
MALVIFPWAFAAVPLAVQHEHFTFVPYARLASSAGLLYTAAFLTIFIHEGGHWLFGRLVGIRIRDFVVGTGTTPLQFTWRGIQFSVGPWMTSGYVREIPARDNLKFGRQLAYLSGGMAAELLFIGMLFLIPAQLDPWAPFEQTFYRLRMFVLVSGGIGILASAWPRLVALEGRMTPNDAMYIKYAWKNRGQEEQTWQKFMAASETDALCQAGRFSEAVTALKQRIESDPGNDALVDSLATIYLAMEEWDQALSTYHALIQQFPPRSGERAHVVDRAATLALQVGQLEHLAKLRPLLEEALVVCNTATLAGTLGSVLLELGETDAGVRLLQRCAAESFSAHDKGIASAYLAKAAFRSGEKQRATKLLDIAKAKCPDHPLVVRIVTELEPQLRLTTIT